MAVMEPMLVNGEQTTKQQLNQLIEKFLEEAKEIDPSIEGAYIGYDGPIFDRPFIVSLAINLERKDGLKLRDTADTATMMIERYQRLEQAYNEHPSDDEAGCEDLRRRHLAAIDEITASQHVATDLPAALLALRQALKEERETSGYRTLTIALLEIGLGFFEAQ